MLARQLRLVFAGWRLNASRAMSSELNYAKAEGKGQPVVSEARGDSCKDNSYANRLVWVDLEMSGLELATDQILEMACIVTDAELNIVAEAPDLIIHHPDSVLDSMGEWCKEHHRKSGLTDAVRKSQISLSSAQDQMVKFVTEHVPKGSCPLAGNTIHVDKEFLQKYMPQFMSHLHYRIVDVSTLKELCRALDDIKESIAELQHYRNTMFKCFTPYTRIFHSYDGGHHYGWRKLDRVRRKPMTICRLLADLPTYREEASMSWTSTHSDCNCRMFLCHGTALEH